MHNDDFMAHFQLELNRILGKTFLYATSTECYMCSTVGVGLGMGDG